MPPGSETATTFTGAIPEINAKGNEQKGRAYSRDRVILRITTPGKTLFTPN